MTRVLVLALLVAGTCAPLHGAAGAGTSPPAASAIPSTDALSFMRRFGYLEQGRPDSETLYTEEAVVQAVKLVQKFGGLEQTGELDESTKKLMKARRCGCPDVNRPAASNASAHAHGPARHSRHRRFVISAGGWKKRHLKYFIANWTPKLGEQEVSVQMRRAFDAWSPYGRLRFSKVDGPGDADITIAFGRGSHGDWFPFDGPGGILAHAFYPYEMASYGGDIHFDDEEQWAASPNASALYEGAVDLFMVAVHEMGHSLGLGHSPDPSSIMFPYYQSKQSASFSLGQDDILAMYELYIKRSVEDGLEDNETAPERTTTPATTTRRPRPTPTTTRRPRPTTTTTRRPRLTTTTTRRPRPTTTTPPPTTRPRPTSTTRRPPPHTTPQPHRPHAHTPTYEGDDETVDEHKKHDKKHGIPDSPVSSNSEENVIPDLCAGNYDAIAQLRGELFVFKGKYLWRLQDRAVVMRGYPVTLQRMFRDLPESTPKVDAVYQRDDGNIILFTGPRYWVYNGQRFVENSPLPLSRYGLPHELDRVDAVMIWAKNRATYFFRGSQFWRYNVTLSRMDYGYPQRISDRWKGVPDSIDDAMTWTNDNTYFFKGSDYYQFDNSRVATERGYPRSAPQYWFGC